MREHIGGIALFTVLAAAIPFLALNISAPSQSPPVGQPVGQAVEAPANTQDNNKNPATTASSAPEPDAPAEPAPAPAASHVVETEGTFRILNSATGRLFDVTEAEYVRGALAAEMPPTFHSEALKAQAVAAHTYALCARNMQKASPDPALGGADFSADPEDWKTYTTEKIFRERYGDMADAYWNAICGAADAARDYVMLYEGEPIVAAYHSMNTGRTEDASNVWTGSAPYLIPVESRGDLLAPDYKTEQRFPPDQVGEALRKAYPGIELGDDPAGWFALGDRSDSGYVLSVRAGDREFAAKELRTLLDLRSTAFDLDWAGGEFCFTVRGYGHGVGLSQYGADYYARQGLDFAQILEHYYPGTELGLARAS